MSYSPRKQLLGDKFKPGGNSQYTSCCVYKNVGQQKTESYKKQETTFSTASRNKGGSIVMFSFLKRFFGKKAAGKVQIQPPTWVTAPKQEGWDASIQVARIDPVDARRWADKLSSPAVPYWFSAVGTDEQHCQQCTATVSLKEGASLEEIKGWVKENYPA